MPGWQLELRQVWCGLQAVRASETSAKQAAELIEREQQQLREAAAAEKKEKKEKQELSMQLQGVVKEKLVG